MNKNNIKDLMSTYLTDGYKKDVISVEDVDFSSVDDNAQLTFKLKIDESFMSSKYGVFFSGITAEVWIYQVCVVLAHLDNDLTKNTKEIILQEKHLKYIKPVSPDNITVTAKIVEKRITNKGRIQYKFDINIGDAVTGYGNAIF